MCKRLCCMDICCHRNICFCINRHPPSDEDFIIIIDITDKIKFLTAFRAKI